MRQRMRAENLTFCYQKQIEVSSSCVFPVIDNEFRHNIVKVVCLSTQLSPRGSTVTLTMLWRNSLSITGQTHEKLTSSCVNIDIFLLLSESMSSYGNFEVQQTSSSFWLQEKNSKDSGGSLEKIWGFLDTIFLETQKPKQNNLQTLRRIKESFFPLAFHHNFVFMFVEFKFCWR